MTDDIEALQAELPPDIIAVLADAEGACTQSDKAELALRRAVEQAPDNLALRVAIYTFYFYANRLADAIPHAEVCLAIAAKSLGVPEDWRLVGPESASFSGLGRPQRVYLKSLVGLGFCRARLGELAEGEAMLRKAAILDPQDELGAGRLADIIARGGVPADDDDDPSDD